VGKRYRLHDSDFCQRPSRQSERGDHP